MKKFVLRGLPEGIIGKSTISLKSITELFKIHPALKVIENKLCIEGNVIGGFAACDG